VVWLNKKGNSFI